MFKPGEQFSPLNGISVISSARRFKLATELIVRDGGHPLKIDDRG